MGKPSRRLAGVIGATLALVTGGCTGTGVNDDPDKSGVAEVQEARFVAIDYAYPVAPAQLEAGLVHISAENHGTVDHEFTLTGIGDATVLDFLEDFKGTGLSGEPLPPFVDQAAVPPFVSVHAGRVDEATMLLSEGHYVLYCTNRDVVEGDRRRPHHKLGMIREIEVVPSNRKLELPEADGTITARDFSFDVDLEAGDRTVNFVNEGPDQIHMAFISVYPEGVTEEEASEAFGGKLEPRSSGVGYTGIFSTGLGAQIEFPRDAIQSGRTYLFQCFVPDREGGKSHVNSHGMYSIVTIA